MTDVRVSETNRPPILTDSDRLFYSATRFVKLSGSGYVLYSAESHTRIFKQQPNTYVHTPGSTPRGRVYGRGLKAGRKTVNQAGYSVLWHLDSTNVGWNDDSILIIPESPLVPDPAAPRAWTVHQLHLHRKLRSERTW